MTGPVPPMRRWARLSLLLAALLQYAGAVAGPWAHEYGRGPASGATLCAPDRHGPHDPVGHDELGCWIWQVLSSAAAPASGSAAAALPSAALRVAPAPDGAAPALPPAAPRARAPPAA